MTKTLLLCAAMLAAVPAIPAHAQSNQLRSPPMASSPRLPSAGQQLNQNLNRQQSGFSTRQQIDGAVRLNRTDQINRQNTRPDKVENPCAGANESCRD
ncbi:hypothetical protein [Roseibium sp. LAB1]